MSDIPNTPAMADAIIRLKVAQPGFQALPNAKALEQEYFDAASEYFTMSASTKRHNDHGWRAVMYLTWGTLGSWVIMLDRLAFALGGGLLFAMAYACGREVLHYRRLRKSCDRVVKAILAIGSALGE